MKRMTSKAPMCRSRPACRNEGVNISRDQSAMGSVSRMDRPTLRKAGGRVRAEGWLAIHCPLNQDGNSRKPVPAGQQNSNHAGNGDHRRRSLDKTHGEKRQKPDRGAGEEANEEEQRRGQMS